MSDETNDCSTCDPETCVECGGPVEDDQDDSQEFSVATIISSQPVPVGWTACYLVDDDAEDEYSIAMLPIILWVLIEYESPIERGITLQSFRHYVAASDGSILDYEEVPDRFLCVTPPEDNDPASTALRVLMAEAKATNTEITVPKNDKKNETLS